MVRHYTDQDPWVIPATPVVAPGWPESYKPEEGTINATTEQSHRPGTIAVLGTC